MCMGKLIIRNVLQWDDDIRGLAKSKISKSSKRILYVRDSKQLASILSSERLSLLIDLNKEQKDVSTVAKKLGRKQEAISRDATILEAAGLLKKIRKGKNTYLVPTVKKIEIELG